MKPSPRLVSLAAVILCAVVAPAHAKPPPAKESKSAPAPDKPAANPLAAWLLEQDGRKDAIALPLGEILRALTHQPILPFDPANPNDAAFLTRLGGVLDRVLPRMNRPDSPAHAAAARAEVDEAAFCFEDEIRAAVRATPGFTPPESSRAPAPGRGYPSVHLVDAKSGRSYYFAVALYPEGNREDATRAERIGEALRVLQGQAIRQIVTGGCCLLVGVEYHEAPNGSWTFLNWDVTDVSNVPVRAAVTFQAEAADVYHPGAVLADGRKGND